mmetsp:Transcript_39984/g.93586  ORF Transcript_39984/g.93586 Transcript_39984/m.93586 type:complete len:211 (-) Transcript_39984:686-1318(-)
MSEVEILDATWEAFPLFTSCLYTSIMYATFTFPFILFCTSDSSMACGMVTSTFTSSLAAPAKFAKAFARATETEGFPTKSSASITSRPRSPAISAKTVLPSCLLSAVSKASVKFLEAGVSGASAASLDKYSEKLPEAWKGRDPLLEDRFCSTCFKNFSTSEVLLGRASKMSNTCLMLPLDTSMSAVRSTAVGDGGGIVGGAVVRFNTTSL